MGRRPTRTSPTAAILRRIDTHIAEVIALSELLRDGTAIDGLVSPLIERAEALRGDYRALTSPEGA